MSNRMRQWAVDGLGLSSLSLRDTVVTAPGAYDVVVKVEAFSLNYRDKLVLENGMDLPIRYPFSPGSDLAGVVTDTGAAVTRFKRGDRVISTFHPGRLDGHGSGQGDARQPPHHTLGGHYPGVASEYVTFPEDWFVNAPVTLDAAEASTLPCAGLTAWFALVERGGIKAGDCVVAQGTGGVALFGAQIAKLHGATAIVTSGSPEKKALAMQLGVDFVIDREGWADRVLDLTQGKGATHILELASGSNLAQSLRAVAIGGHISIIGLLEGLDINAPVQPILLKSVTMQGIGVGHRRALQDLVRAVDATGLKPVIGKRYRFEDLPGALAELDRGPYGKIVITL